jgi:replicative DNA helicase
MNGDRSEERLPPQNIEAEEAVLGSLLMDPDAVIKVGTILRSDDFYRVKNGWIYEAVLNLHQRNEPADFLTVSDELERQGRLEDVGGRAYLTSLITAVPTTIHVEHYALIIERTSLLRRLISAAGQIVQLAHEEIGDIGNVIDRAEQIVFNVSERRTRHDLAPIRQLMDEYYERVDYLYRHQGELTGIPTGFKRLDQLMGGLQRSDLLIVAGRPGMGKTSFALTLARNAARKFNQRVAVFSLEMSSEQLLQRLVSMETRIDSQRLRLGTLTDEEWPVFVESAGVLAETQIFIDDTPAISPLEMRTKARRLHSEHGLDLIIVDYLQLMRADVAIQNRVQEISYISGSLKALARELNLPVIALSQLSRAVEQRQEKRPVLADLRESGSIEQDADLVMFIFREDQYDPNTEKQNIAEIIVAKHRHGPTATVDLFFQKEHVTFHELQYVEERTDDYY